MTLFSGFWLGVYYAVLFTSVAGSLAFVLLYGLFMRWWKTEEGRHLFFYNLAVADAFVLISLRPIFGDFVGRATLTMLCLVSLCVVILWRLSLLVRSYWRNRPSKRALGMTSNGGEVRK